ncbi:MAG: type 1 glutamine amidotransferase domain-containing protein [Phormidesmis sp.]
MKKVLIILSEWGFWGEELIGPLETFDKAGYEITFATPNGKHPVALPPSAASKLNLRVDGSQFMSRIYPC